jgi:hypothetical protein
MFLWGPMYTHTQEGKMWMEEMKHMNKPDRILEIDK